MNSCFGRYKNSVSSLVPIANIKVGVIKHNVISRVHMIYLRSGDNSMKSDMADWRHILSMSMLCWEKYEKKTCKSSIELSLFWKKTWEFLVCVNDEFLTWNNKHYKYASVTLKTKMLLDISSL